MVMTQKVIVGRENCLEASDTASGHMRLCHNVVSITYGFVWILNPIEISKSLNYYKKGDCSIITEHSSILLFGFQSFCSNVT
jgi:hypothetical protein